MKHRNLKKTIAMLLTFMFVLGTMGVSAEESSNLFNSLPDDEFLDLEFEADDSNSDNSI
jgi:hypothetical protein